MEDVIFGSLSTPDQRHQHVLEQRQGVVHHHRRSPRDPLPGQPVQVTLTAGPQYTGRQGWLYWTTDGSQPGGFHGAAAHGFAAPLTPASVTWDTELWGYVRTFSGSLPGQPAGTLVRYRLSLDAGMDETYADGGEVSAYLAADDPPPAWSADALIYHIFVDRFFPGSGHAWQSPADPSGFYGGRITGITEKLDYIQGIGFNTLWLSPIFPSPSHHGYDATDLFSVEPRLGTLDDLQGLLDACHARGMRVLLDFVPNHWSDQHPIFQSALQDEHSPYRDWFTFTRWPAEYETFFGVKNLPQVNLKHPDARQYMISAALHWLNLGVDGFRLDYAIGPAQEFWADFRRQTRAANPHCWTFGEVIHPPDDQLAFEGLLDGCLDFNLLQALRQTIAYETWDVPGLASFLERHAAFFPESFSRPSFLDNHDMNRFLFVVGGDTRKLKLAALCQFCLPGAPIVYYGTEVGLSQQRPTHVDGVGILEVSRLPMPWGEQQDAPLLDFYHRLAALRQATPDLRSPGQRILRAEGQLLVFQRGSTLVVCNIGPDSLEVPLPTPGLQITLATAEVEWTQETIRLSGWSGAVLN